MDIRRLQYFVAAAERLNFSAAARQLGIAQPPLSVQIRKLESEIGGELFRRGRKVQLTPLGAVLLEESRALLGIVAQTTERLQDAAAGRTGTLTIACTPGARSGKLARRLRKFFRKNKGVRYRISEVVNAEDVVTSSDLLFADFFELPTGAIPYGTATVQLAVPPKHRLADRTELTAVDLPGERLFLAPIGKRSPAEKVVADMLVGGNVAIEEVASASERQWLVACGAGLAVTSTIAPDTEDVVRIPLTPLPELVLAVWPNPASTSVAATALVGAIRESHGDAPPRY
jgi:DNA-binding transcriptional LysR family regulator